MRNLPIRPRRNRKSAYIRDLVREHRLAITDFVLPCFIEEGIGIRNPLVSLPSVYRFSVDKLLYELKEYIDVGLRAVTLFPVVPKEKRSLGAEEAYKENSLVPVAIRAIKQKFPNLCVIADIALDPFTLHGHDGVIQGDIVLNDKTVELLAKQALCYAHSGADVLAPSDMMDGRIGRIREVLDQHHFEGVSLLSYSAKYASAFYGPFRDAIGSGLKKGDKKGYQMDPSNGREALREVLLDVEEGADIIMIKPAMGYLDVISKVKEKVNLPVAAYHVSGEYASIMAAAKEGWIDPEAAFLEALMSIKRAGADIIFSYTLYYFKERLGIPEYIGM